MRVKMFVRCLLGVFAVLAVDAVYLDTVESVCDVLAYVCVTCVCDVCVTCVCVTCVCVTCVCVCVS